MLGHLVYSRHAADDMLPVRVQPGWLARLWRKLLRRL